MAQERGFLNEERGILNDDEERGCLNDEGKEVVFFLKTKNDDDRFYCILTLTTYPNLLLLPWYNKYRIHFKYNCTSLYHNIK